LSNFAQNNEMASKKRIIVSVTNDLITDQRVHRTCTTLTNEGFDIILVGRQLNPRFSVKRAYSTKRFKLPINNGPLFYALYNLRLFAFLLLNKADILLSNDLDTLPANYLASRIKGCKLIYDSHEYFCHVPELTDRPFVQNVWLAIERWIFPKLKNVITVNEVIAQLYYNEYHVDIHVIRNLPFSIPENIINDLLSKKDLGIPEGKLIVYQGAVNKDRGLEEAAMAMQYVPGAILLIIGDGDIMQALRKLIQEEKLSDQVILIGKIHFEELYNYTVLADLGIALEKNTNLNYKYSLSNKLFDYIHASIPILSSSLPGSKKLFEKYDIGLIISDHSPRSIATKMESMLNDQNQIGVWKKNIKKAAQEFCWENEEKKLISIMKHIN